MAKKYVSTSRADRTENKRAANKKKKNSLVRDAGLVGLGAAGALAAKDIGSRAKFAFRAPPKPAQLYRANQATNLKAMTPQMKAAASASMSKEDILRTYRKSVIKGQGMSPSRYARLTGGAGAPGRGVGERGGSGGGFLKRSK